MTREEKRTKVVQACIDHQKHIANTAKMEMDSAQQQSNDYGANVDRYDSFRTKMMRNRDMYARQYANANTSLRYLQEMLRMSPMDKVAHGAVVVTDKQRFFLSIGAGKFMVPFHQMPDEPQEVFFAISAQVPIYKLLLDKQTGDSIVFNGIKQTIVDVF